MKKLLIVALACVNIALLSVLLLGTSVPKAKGQVLGADYMMITGQISSDYDAIYILDMASRRLVAMKMDRTRKEMVPYRGVNLLRDFGRSKNR